MTMENAENSKATSSSSLIQATTSPLSERLLAHTLGYPNGWHVVRTVESDGSYYDFIHAGDPQKNVDMYFNHMAAYTAAMKWKEGESTGFENKGGQMLPRVASFKVGDEVEVLYEPDGQWYGATIERVTEYEDDIRYNVHYTEEDSTQNNVYEELIRLSQKPKKKKKIQTKLKLKVGGDAKKKKETPKKTKIVTSKKKPKVEPEADLSSFELAKEIGLPEGWTAKVGSNKQYTIKSPDGKKRFTSKRAALAFVEGVDKPAEEIIDQKSENKATNEVIIQKLTEEEDPPWRKTDHKHLGKRIKYKIVLHDGQELLQLGTVIGWIDESDKDKEGNPGFISEKTGNPAALFHVRFDEVKIFPQYHHHLLQSQDLEEYELLECLIDEKEETRLDSSGNGCLLFEEDSSTKPIVEDDDEIPLTTLLKNKRKASSKAANGKRKKI